MLPAQRTAVKQHTANAEKLTQQSRSIWYDENNELKERFAKLRRENYRKLPNGEENRTQIWET